MICSEHIRYQKIYALIDDQLCCCKFVYQIALIEFVEMHEKMFNFLCIYLTFDWAFIWKRTSYWYTLFFIAKSVRWSISEPDLLLMFIALRIVFALRTYLNNNPDLVTKLLLLPKWGKQLNAATSLKTHKASVDAISTCGTW